MKKSLILLAFTMTATGALADNTMPQAEAAMPLVNEAPKAKQMTDADLDNVTAGFQTIYNNSKKMMTIVNGKGTVVVEIIGARYTPPPPPPPPPGS